MSSVGNATGQQIIIQKTTGQSTATATRTAAFDIGSARFVTMSVDFNTGGADTTWVLDLESSQDGTKWFDLSKTITNDEAVFISATVDMKYVSALITTVEAAHTIDITIQAK